jgi:hypothetical protein
MNLPFQWFGKLLSALTVPLLHRYTLNVASSLDCCSEQWPHPVRLQPAERFQQGIFDLLQADEISACTVISSDVVELSREWHHGT